MRTAGPSPLVALTVSLALLGVACGGGSASTGDAPDTAPDVTSAPVETSTTVVTTTDAAADDVGDPDSARGNATWTGDDFVELATARMEELASTFGQPATPSSVAGLFEFPDDFPYPEGEVIGVLHQFDLDQRFVDEVRISEERIIGVDGPGDAASLDALAETVRSGTVSRWQGASSQRDALNNDLYTAPAEDGGDVKDRLVVRGNPDPEPGESYLRFSFEQRPAEIPVPAWQAGLPVLDGGELTEVVEGRGIVEEFGRKAEDGYIESRHFYPVDRFAELEEFFASGIFESAGFTYEDTPFSNFAIRIDVSIGEWIGTVGVGTVSVDGEDIGYDLLWSLTRPGIVEAPVPATTTADDEVQPAVPTIERPDIESGVPSSPAAPAALEGTTFQWNERNVQWDILLHGLVDTTTRFADDEGRCIHLVGVATPTFIENGFATGATDLPDIGLLAGDDYIADGNDCDSGDLEAAGYDEFDIDGAIVGAPLNVAASFFLEGSNPATIDAVVLGDEDDPDVMGSEDDENAYFTPDVIDAIPPRALAPVDLSLPPAQPLVGMNTEIGFGGDRWATTFHGVVTLPASDFLTGKDDGGVCLAVVGESTPSAIDDGYVTNDAPTMSLIAGGLVVRESGLCETDDLRAAGYLPHAFYGYTAGTTMSFVRSFFVPSTVADRVTTLVVDENDEARQFFEVMYIDTAPPAATATPGATLPESLGPVDAAPIAWTNQRGDIIDWSIEVAGVVALAADGSPTTCFAVIGTLTPASDVDSNFRVPDFSLLAGGVQFRERRSQCNVDGLEAIGYAPADDALVAADTTFSFYEAIPVANVSADDFDRVIVGDASADLQSLAYDPVIIDQAPASN